MNWNTSTYIKIVLVLLAGLVIILVLFSGIFRAYFPDFGFRLSNRFHDTIKTGQLVSSMRIDLNAAVKAEKSAVLADTDEASQTFADQTRRHSSSLEKSRLELDSLLQSGGTSQELEFFREFTECWLTFREIDRVLLDLAVQNTNIKASNLSFGSARNSLKVMEDTINKIINNEAANTQIHQIRFFAWQMLMAALTIHTLQAPHIAESRSERMDEIETEMKTADGRSKAALDNLSPLISPSEQANFYAVKTAYEEFQKINKEIIRLSRKNSNVESLLISLGRKRKVAADCEEALRALSEAVQSRTFKATR
ncbi:MAG: hypothetical protein HQK55_05075 [Deltaproteobacteria bacterium]|nr:hypothetical protein [Deltaproteobacteria bacterium]